MGRRVPWSFRLTAVFVDTEERPRFKEYSTVFLGRSISKVRLQEVRMFVSVTLGGLARNSDDSNQ